uniref:Uncharacterized protein n=1 Tax=Prymnesium polylepis TaxID=72548 RepID=A0A7S4JDF0_9EUKA
MYVAGQADGTCGHHRRPAGRASLLDLGEPCVGRGTRRLRRCDLLRQRGGLRSRTRQVSGASRALALRSPGSASQLPQLAVLVVEVAPEVFYLVLDRHVRWNASQSMERLSRLALRARRRRRLRTRGAAQ